MAKEQAYAITQAPALERLVAFEKVSWLEALQASAEELATRLSVFPDGIFLLSDKREDVCQVTISPKRIPDPSLIKGFKQMRDLPVDLRSKDLWVINIATKEGKRGKGYAGYLLSRVVRWAAESGYQSIVTGVSCDGFAEALRAGTISSIAEYAAKNMNPALRGMERAAENNGFPSWHTDPIPHYWEEDRSSQGYGVLVGIVLTDKA